MRIDTHSGVVHVTSTAAYTLDTLKILVQNLEDLLFFGKLHDLTGSEILHLGNTIFPHLEVLDELANGVHSTELQDYILDFDEDFWTYEQQAAEIKFAPTPGRESFFAELFKASQIKIAQSIKEVASTLNAAVKAMPGKQGRMVLRQLQEFNRQRSTIGTHRAVITRSTQAPNLVILDVSGSMTRKTIETIVEDVVDLAWQANAHLAIVSDLAYVWKPGEFSVDAVMSRAQFGGTHYEHLLPLTQLDWGHVVTIADYDSQGEIPQLFKEKSQGRISKVIDISLVNRPTHLSACMGVLADSVEHTLITNTHHPIR